MRIVESLPRRVQEIENFWIPVGTTGQRMAARLWLPEGAGAPFTLPLQELFRAIE